MIKFNLKRKYKRNQLKIVQIYPKVTESVP